jgi:hypothetical protein
MLLTCAAVCELGFQPPWRGHMRPIGYLPRVLAGGPVTNHHRLQTRLGSTSTPTTIEIPKHRTPVALTNYKRCGQCSRRSDPTLCPAGELGCVLVVGDYRNIPAPRSRWMRREVSRITSHIYYAT